MHRRYGPKCHPSLHPCSTTVDMGIHSDARTIRIWDLPPITTLLSASEIEDQRRRFGRAGREGGRYRDTQQRKRAGRGGVSGAGGGPESQHNGGPDIPWVEKVECLSVSLRTHDPKSMDLSSTKTRKTDEYAQHYTKKE